MRTVDAATPDPLRTTGHVTSTKPLALRDGTIVRGLRVRFENGVAVEIDADANADALSSLLKIDPGALRLGELRPGDRIRRGIQTLRRHGLPFAALCVVSDPRPGLAEELYAAPRA